MCFNCVPFIVVYVPLLVGGTYLQRVKAAWYLAKLQGPEATI